MHYVMNLCASGQWQMVYWLVLCCNKIGACVLSYGWRCFQKTSGQFDCIFVQGLTKGSKFSYRKGKILFAVRIYWFQMDYTQMKLVNLLLERN